MVENTNTEQYYPFFGGGGFIFIFIWIIFIIILFAVICPIFKPYPVY